MRIFAKCEYSRSLDRSFMKSHYDGDCRRCPRLAGFLDDVKRRNPTFFCKPVPPFGVETPRLLIVGLAPGLNGANRTGRPFTGDYAGSLLYSTLHKYGFATSPEPLTAASEPNPALQLIDCRISNAVKCLPPENKPTPEEIRVCNTFLANELAGTPSIRVLLALGQIAHQAVLRGVGLKQSAFAFGHSARHVLPDGRVLIDSYHCSRYNTQTRRLTEAGFHQVFDQIRVELAR
ncbi:MAG: uracil-DNA glycosylase [Burkholderiales bacterium]|nr:uracil-DNA glycosylase [Burkholderiales bacterium]